MLMAYIHNSHPDNYGKVMFKFPSFKNLHEISATFGTLFTEWSSR